MGHRLIIFTSSCIFINLLMFWIATKVHCTNFSENEEENHTAMSTVLQNLMSRYKTQGPGAFLSPMFSRWEASLKLSWYRSYTLNKTT